MAINLSDIDAELARRQAGGDPDLSSIDEELKRRGVDPNANGQSTGDFNAGGVVKSAASAALESSPANLTQKFFQTDPATMQRNAGPVLPVVGGVLGGASGAAAGEFLRQATGTALDPETVPKTPLGRFASVAGAGIAQEPKMLNEIPGVPQVVKGAKVLANATGRGLARLGEAFSGVPAQDIRQLFNKPGTLWKLGSQAKAGEAIGAAKVAAGVNPGITDDIKTFTQQNVEKALDPQATGQNALGKVTQNLANGAKSSVEDIGDALKFVGQKVKAALAKGEDVSELIHTQNHLNTLLDDAAPAVQKARQEFAPIAQRNKFLKPFPVNKNGAVSKANLFYLSSLLGSGGAALGGATGATEGVLGGMSARAPLTTGLLTSAAGGATKGLNVIMRNPEARQVLLSVLQRLRQNQAAQ